MIKPLTQHDITTFKSSLKRDELSQPERDIAYGFALDHTVHGFEVAHHVYGYWLNGEVVGIVEFAPHRSYTHINLIFVKPEHRGQKIGSQLLELVIGMADQEFVTANPISDEAEVFFLKLGFHMDPEFNPSDENTALYEKQPAT